MSTMDSIEERYQDEIARLKSENAALRELIDGVEDVVESFGKTDAQIYWREMWLKRVRKLKEAEQGQTIDDGITGRQWMIDNQEETPNE